MFTVMFYKNQAIYGEEIQDSYMYKLSEITSTPSEKKLVYVI